MNSSSIVTDKSVKAAAAELRSAVQKLAATSLARASEPADLHRAVELVRAATDALEGGTEVADRRSYRARSLFQGEAHLFSPSLRWEDASGPQGQVGHGFRVTMSNLYEGPPGSLHGGYLAGLFDELLGAVQRGAQDGPAYTAKLTVKYRALTPLDAELVFRGWTIENKGRRVLTVGTCMSGDTLCADAEGLFVRAPSSRG